MNTKRLHLALPPIGLPPWAVLRGVLRDAGEHMLTSFVPVTPNAPAGRS